MIAVEEADGIAGVGPAGLSAFQIEEPREPSIAGVDGVEAALADGIGVHVHAEIHLALGENRRGLDLVALDVEATARSGAAASAGVEAPQLGSSHRIEGVHRLAPGHEHPRVAIDDLDVHRARRGEGGAGLRLSGEAPQLAAIGEPERVDVAVPRRLEHHRHHPFAGQRDPGDRGRVGEDCAGWMLPCLAHSRVAAFVEDGAGVERVVEVVEEEPPRAARERGPVRGVRFQVAGEDRHGVRKVEPLAQELRRLRLAVDEADPPDLAAARLLVDAAARDRESNVRVVEVAVRIDGEPIRVTCRDREIQDRERAGIQDVAHELAVAVVFGDHSGEDTRHVPIAVGCARQARGRQQVAGIADERLLVDLVGER